MTRRIILIALLLLTAIGPTAFADSASYAKALREKLPTLKGTARLNAVIKLQELSMEVADDNYRLRCINDVINEAEAQKEYDLFGKYVTARITVFYNLDLNDSVFVHAPEDLQRLKACQQWDRLYEVWTYLVNSYIFTEQYNTALREVQAMFDDAKTRNNSFGMGIAYYTMGNVYANMHNHEEAAASYRKGLDLLKKMEPLPSTIADVYSYYGDLLNDMKDYGRLESLTVEWKAFLEKFIAVNVAEKKLSPDDEKVLWSYYYLACAQASLGMNQLDKAGQMLEEVHRLIPSEDAYVGQSWLYYRAQLYFQQKDYQHALDYNSRRLLKFAGDDDKAGYMMVATQRARILEQLGRYNEVAQIYREVIQIKDSISGSETRNQLNEMNTLFHVDELQREQEHMKMEQEREKFRYTMLIGTLIVLALTVFTIFRIRSARRLKKAHEKLQATHEELQTAYGQLEETTIAKERIESDLRIARNIQMGMVPHNFPERPDLDLYASMTPAKEVGGDLYCYLLIDEKLYFCLGDVSGKGVPASLFMAQATRLFRTLAAQQLMPAQICTQINDALSGEDNETCMFVTMFVGLVDLATGHLDFCNGGHNPPVLLTDGKAEFIEMIPNAPIGLFPGMEYEGEEIADISNRPLFVYTDGLNEAENRQQEQFTDERLLEIMETTPFESCEQTIELLKAEVEKHRDGAEPNDDLTMICVKVIRNNS